MTRIAADERAGEETKVLTTVKDLIENLNRDGIRYCHWKSNWMLAETLEGETDVDLLVHHDDAPRFRSLLRALGFEPSIETGVPPLPSVEHHHALDAASGTVAHVHAYYRVLTGESLAKNYRLPLEEMLLAHVRKIGDVNVPTASAEVIVFVLRMLVKHSSILELLLLSRDWPALRREAEWLERDADPDESTRLLETWLPGLDPEAFQRAFEALRRPAPLWRRTALGFWIRRQLRPFARRGPIRARMVELSKFAVLLSHKMAGSRKKLTPAAGGAVIAFVGSEATGKSTLLEKSEEWLSPHYTVRRIHAGKPPATWVTLLPQRLLPAMRALLPRQRSLSVGYRYARSDGSEPKAFPLIFGLRSVMLAYERSVLLTRAFRWAANGAIVLCDRHPSSSPGSPDSPQLLHLPAPTGRFSLRSWLSAVESRLYRRIPRPNLVIHLTAPLDVTLARNAARDKTEPEEFVRFRHPQSEGLVFEGVPTRCIDTDRPLGVIAGEVQRAIWVTMYGGRSASSESPVEEKA